MSEALPDRGSSSSRSSSSASQSSAVAAVVRTADGALPGEHPVNHLSGGGAPTTPRGPVVISMKRPQRARRRRKQRTGEAAAEGIDGFSHVFPASKGSSPMPTSTQSSNGSKPDLQKRCPGERSQGLGIIAQSCSAPTTGNVTNTLATKTGSSSRLHRCKNSFSANKYHAAGALDPSALAEIMAASAVSAPAPVIASFQTAEAADLIPARILSAVDSAIPTKDDVGTPTCAPEAAPNEHADTAMPAPTRRREPSLPNLKAVPVKPALVRRTLSLSSSEKRAHFREFPIIEMLLFSVTQHTSGARSLLTTSMAAAAATATLVLAAILLFVLFLPSREDEGTSPGCSSADCRHHASLITDRINRSLDPCHDFAAFACSAWSPPSGTFSRVSPSTRNDVVRNWAFGFESTLVTGSRYLPIGEQAVAMYRACLHGSLPERNTVAVRELTQFMAERGLPWPLRPSSIPRARPLGVLIDLAFRWQVPLWFIVRFARKTAPSGANPAVIIRPSTYTLPWFSRHMEIVQRDAFCDHWLRLLTALSYGVKIGIDASKERAEEAAAVDTYVLGELANVQTNSSGHPDEMMLRYVERQYTPNISYDEWLQPLRQHVFPAMDGDHLLRVSNSAILRATDVLFSRFSEETLLDHMGWFFTRMFAPLADASLLRDWHGKAELDEEDLPLFCAAQVEPLFRLLVISLYTVPRLSPKVREGVNYLLRSIRETVAEKVSTLPWLDLTSKQRAQEKLRAMTTVLWPPEELMTNAGLTSIYSSFAMPSPSRSVVSIWLQYRRALGDLHREANQKALHLPANLELPLVEYDYLRNEVLVSVQTLSRPVFYPEGTHAMLYGGLGFLYAAEVVRALDAYGARRDSNGRLVVNASWLSPAWTEALMDREGCLSKPGGYFPEIPAVEVAYASLEKALVSSGKRFRTAGSAFSERRLFYVTLCYLLCAAPTLGARRNPHFAGDCNKAVANFPRFAEDFGCLGDDKMKRNRQCVFFG